jgi:hypothetical protein
MTTRAERAEAKAKRDELAAKYPPCRYCKRPVVAGQVDSEGVPVHHICAIAFLRRDRPHRKAVAPDPRLPQVRHYTRPPEPPREGTLSSTERNTTE